MPNAAPVAAATPAAPSPAYFRKLRRLWALSAAASPDGGVSLMCASRTADGRNQHRRAGIGGRVAPARGPLNPLAPAGRVPAGDAGGDRETNGRASGRERVSQYGSNSGVGVPHKKTNI